MDVTPLGLRGYQVPSGDGAKPHGRDTSLQKTEPQESNQEHRKPVQQPVVQEIPVDIAREHLAATLQQASPGMDPRTAQRLAKLMLDGDSAPEPKKQPTSSEQGIDHVDTLI